MKGIKFIATVCILAMGLYGCKTTTANAPLTSMDMYQPPPSVMASNNTGVSDFEILKRIMLQNFQAVGGEFGGTYPVQPVKDFRRVQPYGMNYGYQPNAGAGYGYTQPSPPQAQQAQPYSPYSYTPSPQVQAPQPYAAPMPYSPPQGYYSYQYQPQYYQHKQVEKLKRFRGGKTLKLAVRKAHIKATFEDKEAENYPAEDLKFTYAGLGDFCSQIHKMTPLSCTPLGDSVKISTLIVKSYPVAPLDRYIDSSIVNVLHHPDSEATLDRGWLIVKDDRIGHEQIKKYIDMLFATYMTPYHLDVIRTKRIRKKFTSKEEIEKEVIASIDISGLTSPATVNGWTFEVQRTGPWAVTLRIANPVIGLRRTYVFPLQGGNAAFSIDSTAHGGTYTVTLRMIQKNNVAMQTQPQQSHGQYNYNQQPYQQPSTPAPYNYNNSYNPYNGYGHGTSYTPPAPTQNYQGYGYYNYGEYINWRVY